MKLNGSASGHEGELRRLATNAHVIEIGHHLGWSATQILETCASLLSIDIKDCNGGGPLKENPRFSFKQGDSRTMTPQACDFLFIDGDHSREAVFSDLERWGDLARNYIAMHDTARRQAHGVRTAAMEWLSMHHEWVVEHDYQHSEGLLVLKRKA